MDQRPLCTGPVLLVGEGDFSFSCSYVHVCKTWGEMFTTSLLNETDIVARHSQVEKNVSYLKEQGATVLFSTDATSLELHDVLKDITFSRIIFNFPHAGGKSNIKKNRKLIKEFCISASHLLTENGDICVTLCKGQGGTPVDHPRAWHNTWQVVSMAAEAGLILNKVHPFCAEKFPSYSSTGFRSQDKHFHTDGALTHVFIKTKTQVQVPLFSLDSSSACDQQTCPGSKAVGDIRKDNQDTDQHSVIPDCGIKALLANNIYFKGKMEPNFLCAKNHPIGRTASDICEALISSTDMEKQLPVMPDIYNAKFSHHLRDLTMCSCSKYSQFVDNIVYKKGTNDARYSHSQTKISMFRSFSDSFPINREGLPVAHECMVICHKDQNTTRLHFRLLHMVKTFLAKKTVNLLTHEQLISENKFLYSLKFCDKFDLSHVIASQSAMNNHLLGFTGNFKCCTNTDIAVLLLDPIAVMRYDIPNVRLLWSTEDRVCNELERVCTESEPFILTSLFPPVWQHDMSFWLKGESFDIMNMFNIVRNCTDDLVIEVSLTDTYKDTETRKTSYCFRFLYQSFDRALPYSKAHQLQSMLRLAIAQGMNIVLR